MSLSQETLIEKIEVVYMPGGYPIVRVRSALVISEGGAEIARRPHRHLLTPDADLSAEPAEVSAVAAAVFTKGAKTAFARAAPER